MGSPAMSPMAKMFVSAVRRWPPGAEGAFFQTDVDVNSTAPGPSMMPVSYRFLWLPRGQNNSDPFASDVFVLNPGESMRHENILASVFGLEPNALGSLAIAADSDTLNVDLKLQQDGADITKRFTFTRGDYLVKVSYLVNNTSSAREKYGHTSKLSVQ